MMAGFVMGFGLVGLLLMVLLWGGPIAVGVWAVIAIFSSGQPGTSPPVEAKRSARDILNNRYARCEITPEQYNLMKQDIA